MRLKRTLAQNFNKDKKWHEISHSATQTHTGTQ